jgi:hypothetical protein
MASKSSDPRRPQDKEAGTRLRLIGSSGVLHRAIPAGNVADGPPPTNVAQEEPLAWLRPSREEIAISSEIAKGKATIIVYALSVGLVMLAWFYLLSLPAMWTTEWF